MRWSRSDLWPLLFLAALVLSLVGPALVGWAGFPPGDFVDQFYAFAHFAAQELAHGRLPLWNPYTFSGHPFLADIQSGIFYPPNLVMLLVAALLGGELPLWALYAQVALHLFLAGVFTYLLARDRLGDRWAALIAALAFALGGYLTSYPVLQLAVLQTDTWLPLLLWLVDKGLRNQGVGIKELGLEGGSELPLSIVNRQWSILNPYSLLPSPFLCLAWAMLLLPGHPQSVMYVGYTVLAWAVYRAWSLGIGWWRGVVMVGVSALVGLGLAAVQYLPSLEYMGLSVRAAASYDRLAHGFPFRDLVGVVAPGLVSLWSPLYVGLVPLALAGVALARGAKGRDTRFWAGLGLVALLLSFGGALFVYPLFYLLVPGFNLFQSQERAALLVSFSLAMLAGAGGLGIREWGVGKRRKVEGGKQRGESTNEHEWTRIGGGQTRVFSLQSLILNPFLLVALTALDLWRVAAPLLIGPPLPPDLGYPAALVAPAQAAPGPQRIENEYRLPANWGVLAGVEDTWGASPLRTQRYADFYAGVPVERRRSLLNVGLVLTWHGAGPGLTEVTRLPVKNALTGVPETTFLLQTTPGPRAWFVAQGERVDDATALAKLTDPQFDPSGVALLAPDTPDTLAQNLEGLPTSSPSLPTEPTPVSGGEAAPGHLTYDFDAPADALLVLSEVWYPGWQAAVDGSPAPVLRAHLTLMAVPVSAGQRHVELRFDPPLVKVGMAVSGVMLLLTLAGLVVGWRARPRGGAA